MGWYLNGALTRFRQSVNARWPGRDRTSDGTIGDKPHQETTSDHNPDADGSVDAWDMDVDGVDVEHLKSIFEAHPASGYWIHARQIASRATGWVRRRYYGSNPHDKHVHWNTRPSHEDSTLPWPIGAAVTPAPPAPTGPYPPGTRTLELASPLMRGRDVEFVQEWIGKAKCGPADGIYGTNTAAGVRWYQRMRGITADGVVGRVTWSQMGL